MIKDMKMRYLTFSATIFFSSLLFASEGEVPPKYEIGRASPTEQIKVPKLVPQTIEPTSTPWLTGPLLVPVPTVVPYGDYLVQAYIYCTTTIGTYNSHWREVGGENIFFSLNPQFQFYIGLTPWCNISLFPQFSYNITSNQHSTQFGDFPVGLDFQLLSPTATHYFPGIKFTIRQSFPTGNYERLHPDKLLTDENGSGSFSTTYNVILYKVYHLYDLHWLSTTYSAAYTLNPPVNVHGFNTYGGGFGTKGKVMPGNGFQGIVSFELTLSKNWGLALDNVYVHTDATQFCGTLGTLTEDISIPSSVSSIGIPSNVPTATIGAPSSEQISFAPAIEYNYNSHFGIIAGCWFSAWGRNSTAFRSGVINIEYTF